MFLFFVDSSLWPIWRIDWWGVEETLVMVEGEKMRLSDVEEGILQKDTQELT